ncbi:MAG: helix-turn-helix domain-containing protein [bacterium]|nr:helix-turn-helix domain-containing protein [bacterium]
MATINIKKTLKEYGLDERESALYLASLGFGEAGIAEIAKIAGIKRTTAYLTFQSLEKKGLMGSFKMRSGLKFVATRPESLIEKAQRQLEELKLILPELKSISQKADGPKIYYYEGKEGYLTATEDSLKISDSTVRHMGSIAEIHKVIGKDYDMHYYVPTRVKRRIALRGLYFEQEVSEDIKKRNDAELREIRYLPKKYDYKTSMLIYGDKVAIFSSKKELFTVIIESKDIAETERNKFDLIWDILEEAG